MSNSFESDAPIVAEGSVLSIIFQNDENGYKVFSIGKGEEDDDEIVCVGIVPMLAVGDNITAWGSYVNHHTYGRQLNVVRFEKSMPTTLKGIELYLGARNIKGVGPKRARQIIEAFGEDSFDVLENHPDKLAALKGISKKQAAAICEEFNDKKRSRAVFMQLQELGISFGASRRLYERYKEETISTILANPYRLADEIYGIGFKIADSIAYRIGIERDSSARIEAGIRFALTQAAANGHVYLPLSRLMQISCELLELHDIVLEERLSAMQVARTVWQDVIDETPVVYLRKYYTAEVFAAKKLLELMRADIEKYSDIDKEITKFEKDGGVTLAKAQRQAVREVLNNGVCVITGGPGTGKTTTIKAVIELLDKLGMHIELAAPTGRAAKRMTEATGFEAKTLHRLLEISFSKDGESQHFGRNKENPLTCDVLIVDEASMIDVTLMSWLLNAVAHGTKLVLVGDVDQLPPIGAGNVLKDIIKSDCVKVVRLTEIFRQAQESAIVMNAHRINNGEYPLLNESGKDFFFMERHSVADVCATINELAVKRLPNYLSTNDIQDIQVLTPMRKGALGAN
ncbi:MAG: AAA family ATPase, partial [Defluviitaleaceae bacterium]|nr:AAA family ATPase [Defluviitaleaceae bacterium]